LHEICFYEINFFSNIGKVLHLTNTFSHNSCGLFIFKKSLKPGPLVLIAVGGANIQIVHFFDHGYLEEEKSMIQSVTATFGLKYLTGRVTSVSPYETFSLIKKIFFVSLKPTKITSKI
jgi:hypothetical protein